MLDIHALPRGWKFAHLRQLLAVGLKRQKNGGGVMAQSFRYLRPESPREACELKAKYGHEAVFWAGGTDLLLEWRRGAVSFEYCIDLSYLNPLRGIQQDGQQTTIGALVTIASLETYRGFENGRSVLREVARHFATPQIRNIATLGGNLCHAVPSADYAVPLIALDAEVKILAMTGERTLPLKGFFRDVKQTALENDELLVEIILPHPPHRSACTFQKVTRSAVDIALVNAAVCLRIDEQERISQARVALGAVAPVPFRSEAAEELLTGNLIFEIGDELLEQAGERAAADTRPISDVRTSRAYRRHTSKVLVKRALVEALGKLKERA
jgi:carbon-monoxide dehydrogenase medium subunit